MKHSKGKKQNDPPGPGSTVLEARGPGNDNVATAFASPVSSPLFVKALQI